MVFMNIAGLLTHHLRFLDLIKERVSSWSPRSTIGDVFLFNVRPCIPYILDTTPHALTAHAHTHRTHRTHTPHCVQTDFIKEYGGYLNKYNTALVTMRHLVEKRPAFKQIKEAFELEQLKTTSLTLDAFLIMPVQRLPRFVCLTRSIQSHSPHAPHLLTALTAHAQICVASQGAP